MENLMDLVLHPIRLRIVLALTGREMTAQQVAEALGDVPPATLYRHLNRLAEAGVLAVAAERRVRGTLEKTYTLNTRGPHMEPDELASLSKEDHLRYFTTFAATLLDDFSRYVQQAETVNLAADGVSYSKAPLELSDDELAAMSEAIYTAILPYLKNQPAPGRKRRMLSTILMPDLSQKDPGKQSEPAPDVNGAQPNTIEETK